MNSPANKLLRSPMLWRKSMAVLVRFAACCLAAVVLQLGSTRTSQAQETTYFPISSFDSESLSISPIFTNQVSFNEEAFAHAHTSVPVSGFVEVRAAGTSIFSLIAIFSSTGEDSFLGSIGFTSRFVDALRLSTSLEQSFTYHNVLSATFTSPVTPVPEPEIYAMMGLGLGLLGWVGRRKKLQAA